MEDPAQSLAVGTQQFYHVVIRIAHVDNAGQIEFAGQAQVRAEDLALDLAWREHAKIVQAELTNGHHFWLQRQRTIRLLNLRIIGRRIMWMRANAGKNRAGIGPGQRQRGLAGGKIAARIDDPRHSTGEGGLNDGRAVGVKTGSVDVGMAINEQLKISFPTNKRGTRFDSAFPLSYLLEYSLRKSVLSNLCCMRSLPCREAGRAGFHSSRAFASGENAKDRVLARVQQLPSGIHPGAGNILCRERTKL